MEWNGVTVMMSKKVETKWVLIEGLRIDELVSIYGNNN